MITAARQLFTFLPLIAAAFFAFLPFSDAVAVVAAIVTAAAGVVVTSRVLAAAARARVVARAGAVVDGLVGAVVGGALDDVAVLVVAGDGNLRGLQLLLDVDRRGEHHLAGVDELLGHLVHVLHGLRVHAEADGAQTGDGYRVTLRHPCLDDLADGVPGALQCSLRHAAAHAGLLDDLRLRQLAVRLGAHQVEPFAGVLLVELDQCLLCFDVNHTLL